MIMDKIPRIVGWKLAWSIWLGNGIEFQLLPLTVLVFCLEMLINASLSSETSALESRDSRSNSDSFHDYANRTPLKLSHAIQLIIMDEDKFANSYCETVSGFECVSAWERDAFIFVYFEKKTTAFGHASTLRFSFLYSPSQGSYDWDVIFIYDTIYQSFWQSCEDRTLMSLTIYLSRANQREASRWQTVEKQPYASRKQNRNTRLSQPYARTSSFHTLALLPFSPKGNDSIWFNYLSCNGENSVSQMLLLEKWNTRVMHSSVLGPGMKRMSHDVSLQCFSFHKGLAVGGVWCFCFSKPYIEVAFNPCTFCLDCLPKWDICSKESLTLMSLLHSWAQREEGKSS